MKKIPLFYLVLIVVFQFFGCDGEIVDPEPDPDLQTIEELRAELINKNWELRTVEKNGYGTFAPEIDSMYIFRFFEDENFTALEICNHCFGSYEIDSLKQLSFDGFGCTEKACSGFQYSIPFSIKLNRNAFPFHFDDGELYIKVNDEEEENVAYKFSQYDSLKQVIMANPEGFSLNDWPNGGFHHLEATISDDTLDIELRYSGCGVHDLNIVFYDYFMKSNPVQAYAFIAHTSEACRAVFQSEEKFDLTPLKEKYFEYYGGNSGVIDISIIQHTQTEKKLRYTF